MRDNLVTLRRYSAQDASLYARQNDERDFAQKIVELLDDPDRRRIMGDYGRKRVEDQLAWKYEIPRLLKAYNTLLERLS